MLVNERKQPSTESKFLALNLPKWTLHALRAHNNQA